MAQAEGAGPSLLVREAADALAGLEHGSSPADPWGAGQPATDPRAFVTAARRLVDRHPTVAPMWWLAARVMASPEPGTEARLAAEAMEVDSTPEVLASALPDDATVLVVGRSEQVSEALLRRVDLEVLVVDCGGAGAGLVRSLERVGVETGLVPATGIGSAAGEADLVLLEAVAMGPDGFLAAAGSCPAAAVARQAAIAVWVAAGVGRVLPPRLWDALLARHDQAVDEPWHCPEEIVPTALVDRVVRPEGLVAPEDATGRGDCAAVPELLRAFG